MKDNLVNTCVTFLQKSVSKKLLKSADFSLTIQKKLNVDVFKDISGLRALILFKILALYKSFTYLLTYLPQELTTSQAASIF